VAASEFDIIVIGAGIAGTSAAARLAAENRRVLVLERESQPGYHSTGRSAALFSEIYGAEPVRALSRASHDHFYAPPPGFCETPLVKRRGALHVASADQLPALEAFAALPDVAAATRRLTRAEAIAICPMLREEAVAAAVFEPDAADVDVHALHQGYLRMLRQHGGQLLTDRPVESLVRDRDQWILTSGEDHFSAPVIINAAGAWADVVGGFAGAGPIGLQPMRRTALLVEPPAGVASDAWPMVIDVGEQFYFKPDAGLLLLSPADETPVEPCDVQADEWDIAVAIDRVEAATTLKVRTVKHRWAGLRSFVADRVPVAGYDPNVDDFFWLAGQGGYGIQTAPAMAETAAALVLGRPLPASLTGAGVDAGALSPTRIASLPRAS
jgi:D-arginine dehydrogenase